jgi:hypothetical protein
MHQVWLELRQPAGLPDDVYAQGVEAVLDAQRQEATAARAYQAGAQRFRTEYERRVHEVVAAAIRGKTDKYDAFRTAHRARMRALGANPPATDEARRRVEAERRKLVDESERFLVELGIDGAALRRVHDEVWRELSVLRDATYGLTAPAEPRPRVKNTTFTAPYAGGSFSPSWWKSFAGDEPPDPTFDNFANFTLGTLGVGSSISMSDASDFDEVLAHCRASLFVWFRTPPVRKGQKDPGTEVQVRYSGKWIGLHSDGSADKEWGYAGFDFWQSTVEYARVHVPALTPLAFWPATPAPWHLHEDVHIGKDAMFDNLTWNWSWPAGGAIQQGFITIPEVFPASTWLLIEVGLMQDNHFLVNDYTVNSNLDKRIHVTEIGVAPV